jgi:septal ring factor EnvC (AmiA/AmiB activator)
MEHMTGFATVPNTLASIPSTNMGTVTATAMVTKTVIKTVSAAVSATKSSAIINNKPSPPAHPSNVPSHLLDQVAHLYTSTLRPSVFAKPTHMSLALRILLAAAVTAGDVTVIYKRLPKIAQDRPRGENERSWRQKLTYVYKFLKNAANDNEQLRKDILKAHYDRDRARQDKMDLESTYTAIETESNKATKDIDAMQRQMGIHQQEIMDFRTANTNLKNELAGRHNQTEELFQMKHDSADMNKQLSQLQAEKAQLTKELHAARQHPIELQNQVEQLVHEKTAIVDESYKAQEESAELQKLLSTAQEEKEELQRQLQSANTGEYQQTQALQQLSNELRSQLERVKNDAARGSRSFAQSLMRRASKQMDCSSPSKQRRRRSVRCAIATTHSSSLLIMSGKNSSKT